MKLILQPLNITTNGIQNIKLKSVMQQNNFSQITRLSNFPMGYSNISFKGNDDTPHNKNVIAKSEKELSIEDKLKIQSKYLWGVNWDEEEAEQRYKNDADNEITIRNKAALFGLRKSTKLRIKESYRQKFLAEKAEAKAAKDLAYIYPLTIGIITDVKALSVAENFKNRPTSMDKNIAGYKQEKEYLRRVFIDVIALEKTGKDVKVPNGLLLHGPTGCGKTVIARALAEETGCEIFDLPTGTKVDLFKEIILEQLNEAKERYLSDGKRTIIIINELENYLDESIENKANLSSMKGILDFCADKPSKGKRDGRYGTTFIFTTNHPSMVDTDLYLRPEKIQLKIKLMPPEGENFEKVFRHYVEIAKKTVDDEITKGRNLKPISAELPYSTIAKYRAPSKEKGAISCAKLKEIAENATQKYLMSENKSEFITLLREGLQEKRDITPAKLATYNNELEAIQGKALSRLEELREARDMGIITHDELLELIELEEMLSDKE